MKDWSQVRLKVAEGKELPASKKVGVLDLPTQATGCQQIVAYMKVLMLRFPDPQNFCDVILIGDDCILGGGVDPR